MSDSSDWFYCSLLTVLYGTGLLQKSYVLQFKLKESSTILLLLEGTL